MWSARRIADQLEDSSARDAALVHLDNAEVCEEFVRRLAALAAI